MTRDATALLAAARDGDQTAWDELVARYNALVWSIARSFRLNTADAGDAAQMTWLRLVEHLPKIKDPERIAGWLATTARHECLHLLRKSGREQPSLDEDVVAAIPDDAPPVDAAVLLDERDGALWNAFRTIGERCQQLLRVLMATPPPSYQEVSAALDMPIGTIGPSRQRCLAQLRKIVLADDSLVDAAAGRPGMTTPDDELMAGLARIAAAIDPPPDLVIESARAAFETRALDDELADLLRDSALAVSGVRGDGPRMLTFETKTLTIELQLERAGEHLSLAGLVVGAADGIEVQTFGAAGRDVPVDEHGWFRVDDLPADPFRVRVSSGAATVGTGWIRP